MQFAATRVIIYSIIPASRGAPCQQTAEELSRPAVLLACAGVSPASPRGSLSSGIRSFERPETDLLGPQERRLALPRRGVGVGIPHSLLVPQIDMPAPHRSLLPLNVE